MSDMISISSGFQYSVNIGYDLNNDEKLKNFIPTKSALDLMESIISSTNSSSTERARILIGAYGKGKSHIILATLAILMKRDFSLFKKAMPKIKNNQKLYQSIKNYYESSNKILPVIITGSNTSLSQAFLLALQRTLSMNGLMDVMPETNYKAAVNVIHKWEKEYPDTYLKLQELIDKPISEYIADLEDYNIVSYETFERIYPKLTAGSVFNPFLGFDVVELYEEALRGLKSKGYTGIYVIYDEFSKYLESNITEASVSDTKMLQDFAEKSNRSGGQQLHLMLISHKEISNYIDKLPKQKVDGWRGVSERFKHIHLNNNFSQTYEIIASVIQKKEQKWNYFCELKRPNFSSLIKQYKKHNIFSDIDREQINQIIFGCYPLHPISTFILPRLSERIAQNERTLFTFLSSDNSATLLSFLKTYDDNNFELITPDLIYDYFESLLRKEAYDGSLYETYILTEAILSKIEDKVLESKIVKTISLIYMLEQFEKLQPTKEEILMIFSNSYTSEEIQAAIDDLIENEYVIYLKRSNNYLRLKQTTGVDIRQKIKDTVAVQQKKVAIKEILNNSNFDNYLYPSRYNNERDINRYFAFEFINSSEIKEDVNWDIKSSFIKADGVVYGILLDDDKTPQEIKEILLKTSKTCNRVIFALPKHCFNINDIALEFYATSVLRDQANDDKLLFNEYDVIYDDLQEVINTFIRGYTRPEEYKTNYIFDGTEVTIKRKASLTELMSSICDNVYSKTPVINSEVINKNEITSVANTSRNKIVAALLRNELEPNLGFSGSGQEVSIMRSTLIRTGIWEENDGISQINLHPTKVDNIAEVLSEIEKFIIESNGNKYVSFAVLYERLTSPKYHYGLRKGIIPLFLAAVMHQYKREIVILEGNSQVSVSADTLVQINSKPENFSLTYLDWDEEREEYIQKLDSLFASNIISSEKNNNTYDYILSAMKRWYWALPKFTKECKKDFEGNDIPKKNIKFLRLIRDISNGNELLFDQLPKEMGFDKYSIQVSDAIANIKQYYDTFLQNAKNNLIGYVKTTFAKDQAEEVLNSMSLSSIIKDWCESLNEKVFNQLFSDGTDKCLKLFKEITNDDDYTITQLSKLATNLRIEDWGERTKSKFEEQLKRYKETAESYQQQDEVEGDIGLTSSYQISFIDASGAVVTKQFERTEETKRGQHLYNQVTSALNAMGRSITEQEKRQILMEILKSLC